MPRPQSMHRGTATTVQQFWLFVLAREKSPFPSPILHFLDPTLENPKLRFALKTQLPEPTERAGSALMTVQKQPGAHERAPLSPPSTSFFASRKKGVHNHMTKMRTAHLNRTVLEEVVSSKMGTSHFHPRHHRPLHHRLLHRWSW